MALYGRETLQILAVDTQEAQSKTETDTLSVQHNQALWYALTVAKNEAD